MTDAKGSASKSGASDKVEAAFEALKFKHTKPNGHAKPYAYQLVPFADLRPGTKSAYLIDGVIPRTGLVAVWGPPKSGKSFWTFDLVMHIALNRPYRGRRVNGGPVCYLAFEGAEGFRARAEAFRRMHEIADVVPFFMLASNAKLVRDHRALIESIDGQIGDWPPVAVVLDTLNRSIDGSESKDEDMGAYLAAAEAIAAEFDCVVIIVHHCGIDGSRPRGHTSLTGAAAAQIAVKRDGANNVLAAVEAMKDGAEGASFTSTLKPMDVGIDDEGQPITSCVIVPVEGQAPTAKAAKRAKLSPTAVAALRSLHDCLADMGKPAPASTHVPVGVTCVTLAEWRGYLEKHTLINREGGYREQFRRIRVTLKNAGNIGIWDELVWSVT